jgi:hypothetical protein
MTSSKSMGFWPTPTGSQARSEGMIKQMRKKVEAKEITKEEAEQMIMGSLEPKRMEPMKNLNKEKKANPPQTSSIVRLVGSRDHANLSVLPGSKEARKMTVISGQNILGLYKQSGPVGCCVRTLLGSSLWGSTKCFLTWKVKTTPKESRSTSSISDNSPQGENKAFQLKGTSGRSNIKNVANTAGKGWERRLHRGQNQKRESQQGYSGCGSTVRIKQEQNWWAVEPDVGRVADGIPTGLHGHWDIEPDIPRVTTGVKGRIDRLKQLGNAVVPQVVEQIGRAIMQIEENE